MVRHGAKINVKGFTLVELMVVVAIIALLATISTPNLFGFLKRTKARDGANALASYLQNARDQAMSRGEVVLLRVTLHGVGKDEMEVLTFRAPPFLPVQEQTPSGVVSRDRFVSSCAELNSAEEAPFSLNHRVAALNPQGATTNLELAEKLDPNVRLIGHTDPATGAVVSSTAITAPNLDLCFSPDGRVFSSSGAEILSNDGVCSSSLVFLVTSDPDVSATPSSTELLGNANLGNWVCPTSLPPDAAQRKAVFTTLDVAREASFVYAVSMSFNGRVKVD